MSAGKCVVCDTTVGDIIVVYLKDDSPDFYCVDCVREINQFPFYVSMDAIIGEWED